MTRVAWLVPSLIEGSGGHRTILQNAAFLKQAGYDTTIYLESDPCTGVRDTPAGVIARQFGYPFDDVRIGWHDIAPCDIAFATIWYSAKVVRDLKIECRRMYFVQDWEAAFNPIGDVYLMAENSFRYGLTPVTIGNWLRHEIRDRFHIGGFGFDFCADTSIYRRIPNVSREPSIAFICQPEKPRRGTMLGLEALGIVKHFMPGVRIYLYGSRQRVNAWFEYEELGLLPLDECNALYNRSTVGLCISCSNPSRIPFEMMAAGLPVVELHRANTIYDLPEHATLLCDQAPESLAEGLMHVLRSEERRQAMSDAGVAFMAPRTLEYGMRQFLEAVRWVEAATPTTAAPNVDVPRLYHAPPMTASPYLQTLPPSLRPPRRGAAGRKPQGGVKGFFSKVGKAVGIG